MYWLSEHVFVFIKQTHLHDECDEVQLKMFDRLYEYFNEEH